MNARVPTLPTPTTLRAMSTTSNSLEQVAAIVLQASPGRRGTARGSRARSRRRRCRSVAASSRSGMTIGGWLTIRYRPSTCSASFDSACRLSRVRAFSAVFSARFCGPLLRRLLARVPFRSSRAAFSIAAISVFLRQAGVPDVHRAHLGELGHRLSVGASPTRASRRARRPCVKPLLRAAIVKLAAMRFTSYSNGPGSVSSKSFRSNSSVPLGRREHTEVRQMRVAAQLDVQARPSACPSDRRP